jgi:hypothetical protein
MYQNNEKKKQYRRGFGDSKVTAFIVGPDGEKTKIGELQPISIHHNAASPRGIFIDAGHGENRPGARARDISPGIYIDTVNVDPAVDHSWRGIQDNRSFIRELSGTIELDTANIDRRAIRRMLGLRDPDED